MTFINTDEQLAEVLNIDNEEYIISFSEQRKIFIQNLIGQDITDEEINEALENTYLVKKYGEPSLLTYSQFMDNLFGAIHLCIKQGNSCVIPASSIGYGDKEIFIPAVIK